MTPSPRHAAAAALIVLGAAASAAVAQVYQCEQGGVTIFSQTPCAADAEPVEIRSAPAGSPSSSGLRPAERARLQQFDAEHQDRIERRRAARAENRRAEGLEQSVRNRAVSAGMSAEQVRRSWGAPAEVVGGVDSYGSWERWEYIRGKGGPRQYVRFRNGEVTSASSWPR